MTRDFGATSSKKRRFWPKPAASGSLLSSVTISIVVPSASPRRTSSRPGLADGSSWRGARRSSSGPIARAGGQSPYGERLGRSRELVPAISSLVGDALKGVFPKLEGIAPRRQSEIGLPSRNPRQVLPYHLQRGDRMPLVPLRSRSQAFFTPQSNAPESEVQRRVRDIVSEKRPRGCRCAKTQRCSPIPCARTCGAWSPGREKTTFPVIAWMMPISPSSPWRSIVTREKGIGSTCRNTMHTRASIRKRRTPDWRPRWP